MDIGLATARRIGLEKTRMSLDDSVAGLLGIFDGASLENSGTFVSANSEEIVPW